MKSIFLHIIFLFILPWSILGQHLSINLPKTLQAGTPLTIKFNKLTNATALYCTNSYANILIQPTQKKDSTYYKIPKFITNKTGWLYWELTKEHKNNKGKIKITPVNSTDKIETYLGPPSIQAGFDDHSMLVVIPIDSLNNPLVAKTPVIVKKSINQTQETSTIKTDGIYAYKYLDGSVKTGRALISSECLNKTSKELSLEIMPSPPVNFTIRYDRIHDYADGNQITQFYTSIIKDCYGNIIGDGTLINFNIVNKKGNLLNAQGVSIRGIATCQMVHPDHEEKWTVHAYVDKFSQSNYININYKKAVKGYETTYSSSKKTVTVGPFKSFMEQVLPDGLVVRFKIFHQKELIKKITIQSEKGFAIIRLKDLLEPHKKYTVIIEAAEIHKTIQIEN